MIGQSAHLYQATAAWGGVMPRFIEISMAIENGVPSDPPGYEFDVRYISHAETVPILQGRTVAWDCRVEFRELSRPGR